MAQAFVGTDRRRTRAFAPRCAAALLTLMLGCLIVAPARAQSESAGNLQDIARVVAEASAAVVGVHSRAIEGARSADSLGSERIGSGVVIDRNGLVVTIGYLVMETEAVDLIAGPGKVVPARVVAYDIASGFALLQALAPLDLPPMALGATQGLKPDEPLVIASGGETIDISLAHLVARRPFQAHWEYGLDDALFVAPPRADHSGAALLNRRGELLGIGSLLVADALGPGSPRTPGNLFVPADLLRQVLPELRAHGATPASRRAWLGLQCAEVDNELRVMRVAPEGPADDAGLRRGDRIVSIDGTAVATLAAFYRALWQGAAERSVSLVIERDGQREPLTVQTRDRTSTFKRATSI